MPTLRKGLLQGVFNLIVSIGQFTLSARYVIQGGHKPGKLREFEELSKSQKNSGKFEFLWKKPKQGK